MRKVSFEERKEINLYLLHKSVPQPIEVVECDEYGTVKTSDGRYFSAPCYNELGEVFAQNFGDKWYIIEEDHGLYEDHMGPWFEDPFWFEMGVVVTLEGTPDEENYMFDGWCNLYPKTNK